MLLKEVMEAIENIDQAGASGAQVEHLFAPYPQTLVQVTEVKSASGKTDFIKITVPGKAGKLKGGMAPTMGIVGRLGGVGARPGRVGMVSDADGAVAAVAAALKLARMTEAGDQLTGDVMIATHICPDAPTHPHEPVDFMGSPVDILTMNRYEIDPQMAAVLSIDTTKGNNIMNYKGIAISPTVKEGYILRVSSDLVQLLEMTSGQLARTFPVTTQDITPYGNGVYHINSILQPATATAAPVVGVAITCESAVPGCGTGASHEVDIAQAATFALETAKAFGDGKCQFYDAEEYQHLLDLYGQQRHFQTLGAVKEA